MIVAELTTMNEEFIERYNNTESQPTQSQYPPLVQTIPFIEVDIYGSHLLDPKQANDTHFPQHPLS